VHGYDAQSKRLRYSSKSAGMADDRQRKNGCVRKYHSKHQQIMQHAIRVAPHHIIMTGSCACTLKSEHNTSSLNAKEIRVQEANQNACQKKGKPPSYQHWHFIAWFRFVLSSLTASTCLAKTATLGAAIKATSNVVFLRVCDYSHTFLSCVQTATTRQQQMSKRHPD